MARISRGVGYKWGVGGYKWGVGGYKLGGGVYVGVGPVSLRPHKCRFCPRPPFHASAGNASCTWGGGGAESRARALASGPKGRPSPCLGLSGPSHTLRGQQGLGGSRQEVPGVYSGNCSATRGRASPSHRPGSPGGDDARAGVQGTRRRTPEGVRDVHTALVR